MPLTDEQLQYQEGLSIRNIDRHLKTSDYAFEEINKIIFVMATGTFVLSISFIGYMKVGMIHPILLIWAWIFLHWQL